MLGLLASAPALPLGEAGKYVAAAYIVFLVLIVVYVAIMAAKLQRIERELGELAGFAEQRRTAPPTRDGEPVAGHSVEAAEGLGGSAAGSRRETEQPSV